MLMQQVPAPAEITGLRHILCPNKDHVKGMFAGLQAAGQAKGLPWGCMEVPDQVKI